MRRRGVVITGYHREAKFVDRAPTYVLKKKKSATKDSSLEIWRKWMLVRPIAETQLEMNQTYGESRSEGEL